MTIPEAKRKIRINEWQQLIQEQQQSGLSIRKWCERSNIRETSYYYWLKIIREEALTGTENLSGQLVRIEPEKLPSAAKTASSHSGIVIRHGESTIELPEQTPPERLAALVRALNRHA